MLSASSNLASCSRKARSPNYATATTSKTSRRSSSRLWRLFTPGRRTTEMNLRNIAVVYRKELREALRDRRTLISTLLVPLILFPLLSAGLGAAISALIGKAKEEIPKIMILGGDDSPGILAELHGSKKIKIVPTQANWKDQIINKEIRAAVEIPPGFQSDLAREDTATVRIHNYEGDLKSSIATDNVQKGLEKYREGIV